MLNEINDMIQVVRGCLGDDSKIDLVDSIDELQFNMNTEDFTAMESVAYNELNNLLYSYYSGK